MNPALDAYVLGLAVASTPCFGYHERGNPTCGACPVADKCVDARALRAVTVAAQLTKAAEKAAAAKAAKAIAATAPITVNAPATESIDDILDSIARTPATAQTVSTHVPAAHADFDLESLFGDVLKPDAPAPVAPPTPPVQAAPAPAAPRVTVMKAVIDSVCFVCNGRVPAKSEAAFIPGKGLRHMTCA